DLAAPGDVQFFRDALRDRERGDAAGLSAADHGPDAESGFEAHFGNLRGLARAGFTGDDDHLMLANGGDDLILARRDGKVGRITNARDNDAPSFAQSNGGAHLVEDSAEQRFVFVGMMTVAQ